MNLFKRDPLPSRVRSGQSASESSDQAESQGYSHDDFESSAPTEPELQPGEEPELTQVSDTTHTIHCRAPPPG
jgi:hypothetical protein